MGQGKLSVLRDWRRPRHQPLFQDKVRHRFIQRRPWNRQNDYEPGIGLEWTAGPNLVPFVDFGYRFVGSPAGLDLSNAATTAA